MKTEVNPHFFPMDKKMISPHIEKLMGKNPSLCTIFFKTSTWYPKCMLHRAFTVYAIHKYFISMPTPAMGFVISQISNRWYFVILKCFPTCRTQISRKMFLIHHVWNCELIIAGVWLKSCALVFNLIHLLIGCNNEH